MINQNVVGFIMGCYDTKIQIKQWISSILPLIMKKTVGGQYHFGPLTWHYLFALCRQKMVEKKQVIDLSVYPAHLHINVDKDWRGLGIGEKLLQEYINLLKGKKVVGVHLNTTDQNQAACKLYEKMGFQLIASHSTKLWSYWLDHLVEIRSYGLRL
jgi:ribosomal protein S18 acetylase RimI-like enzyme